MTTIARVLDSTPSVPVMAQRRIKAVAPAGGTASTIITEFTVVAVTTLEQKFRDDVSSNGFMLLLCMIACLL